MQQKHIHFRKDKTISHDINLLATVFLKVRFCRLNDIMHNALNVLSDHRSYINFSFTVSGY